MIVLTGHGSFAKAYLKQNEAEVASYRELDEASFISRIKQAKTVIHNAASLGVVELEPALTSNFDFTRYLVQQLTELNPDVHLIFISSMSILDPADDQLYGDVLQMTAYAYSKYLAETYALKSSLKHVSCVRFSTLFYQDPAKDGLSKLIAEAVKSHEITILNGGEARRNFLPLHIAADYVHKLAAKKPRGKKVYNIAAPGSTSFNEVAMMLQKIVPELKVNDQPFSGNAAVLSEFKTADIQQLGQIDFSLEDEIGAYIKILEA